VLFATLLLAALAQAGGADSGAVAAPAASSAPAEAPTAPAPTASRLPAGTEVQVELAEDIGSATSHVGDRFALRLAEPIVLDGKSVVPAGAPGQGEVIDAARAGMAGKQGKLIISARYLDLAGRHVRIHGMTLLAAGKSRVDLAQGVLLLPYVGVTSALIRGGEITIPAGTRATVKLAEDVELPASPPPQDSGKQ
jgi:hypothetical protein